MLNLNACLAKAGVEYSTLWSEDFTDPYFLDRLLDKLASVISVSVLLIAGIGCVRNAINRYVANHNLVGLITPSQD
jgi:hypothetical protein